MKKWILKAVVQKTISFLPYKHRINFLFQKYITKGVRLSDDYFLDKLIHFKHHQKFANQYLGTLAQKQIFELGTGWYPVIPIAFFLNDVAAIKTVDIAGLLSKRGLIQTIEKFVTYHQTSQLASVLDYDEDKVKKLEELLEQAPNLELAAILNQLNIDYTIGDAAEIRANAASFDLLVSNNTFEHVYPKDLNRLLSKFKQIVKKEGLMVHFIDMSDHFAHLDQSITIYNFLRFSEKEWQRIDNTIQPQNRWRINQYRDLYQQLEIPITEEEIRPGRLKALSMVPLDPFFDKMSKTDVMISHVYIVSKMN
ncbi:MAG: hypothetical protein Sapg2KO_29690 [Saprospiraceae bacterium]